MPLVLAVPVANAIVRFLLDRLDDDYAVLDRDARSHRGVPDPFAESPLACSERLRAEIIAKRHVIGNLQHLLILRDQPFEEPVREVASNALRSMTEPYSEHRGFRDEWAGRGDR